MKNFFKTVEDLNHAISQCKKCNLCKTRNKVVCGEGNASSNIMIIAEAPGFNEDNTGTPFVGKAGELLDSVLNKLKVNRKDIFISNIVKCHPPKNRNPLPNEINSCLDYLRNQVLIIKPKVIVLLGSVPLKTIIGEDCFISKCRGKWIEKKGIYYLPTWHPSAVLRDPSKLPQFTSDLTKAFNKLCQE